MVSDAPHTFPFNLQTIPEQTNHFVLLAKEETKLMLQI
jgi:hypothetical protein